MGREGGKGTFRDVCQFCGACGVGAVLGTVVRSAWRVWLVEEERGSLAFLLLLAGLLLRDLWSVESMSGP